MDSQVAKRNSAGALANINLRADSGKGAEEIKSDDVSTPILKILHQLSPECNERDAKHVEGAKPGMIYSSGFGSLIESDKGLDVVIAHAQTRYPEWQERGDSASAPVGTHIEIPAEAKEEKNGRYRLPNGNYVEKTAYFYVLAMVDGEVKPAVIPMRSSNLSPARELNNLIKNLRFSDDKGSFNPASYAAVYNLKTVGRTAGSKSWHVYKPSRVRNLDVSNKDDASIYEVAQQLQKNCNVKVQLNQNTMHQRILET
ncbi:MAG: hypothetical protein CM15mV127_210 [Caudoviricetes sp.]|nr:MAG: hypothetical protein CM15mV127_210 [Caudoviricetes sp.]